jgi:phenylalanyl-tRNA synthetase beta chain
MKVLYSWLQDHTTTPLPTPERAAELLTAHVGEVDEMVTLPADTLFDIKVLPDRAHYLLSHIGIARELAYFSSGEFQVKSRRSIVPTLGDMKRSVTIEAPERCLRYMAQEIDTGTVAPTPHYIRERLVALGQKSINAIVDIGNYVMFETGQPIHVFDADKVVGNVIVRLAKPDEKIVLLTGEEVTLINDDLVIADTAGPLAIAGVKGGKRAEVTSATTRLLVEAANFTPVGIRKTATRLNLRNDSSKRFENEITPDLGTYGLALVSALVGELHENAVASNVLDVYANPVTPWSVSITADTISALLGIEVSVAKITAIMTGMECSVSGDASIIITPPLYRLDIKTVEDVADEVGRSLGYADLPSILPPALPSLALPDPLFYHGERIKNILIERGYHEALLYSLVPKGHYEIVYPLASDKAALRESLVPLMSAALKMNMRNAEFLGLDVVRMCEVGKVFTHSGERLHVCFGTLPIKKQKGVTAETILREDITAVETALATAIDAVVSVGEWGAIASFDLEWLLPVLGPAQPLATLQFSSLPQGITFEKISPYPFIIRDVAVFVPESVSSSMVHDVIVAAAGPLCVKSWVFDVFSKEVDGVLRHSYGIRMVFQSFERTLEEADIAPALAHVYAALQGHAGWEIR